MDMDKFNKHFDRAMGQVINHSCKCERCNRPIIKEEDFSIIEPDVICNYCFEVEVTFIQEGLF